MINSTQSPATATASAPAAGPSAPVGGASVPEVAGPTSFLDALAGMLTGGSAAAAPSAPAENATAVPSGQHSQVTTKPSAPPLPGAEGLEEYVAAMPAAVASPPAGGGEARAGKKTAAQPPGGSPDPPAKGAAIMVPDPLPVIAPAQAAPDQPSADPVETTAKTPSRGGVDRPKAKDDRSPARAPRSIEPAAAAPAPSTPPVQGPTPAVLALPPPPLSGDAPRSDPLRDAAPLDAVGARTDTRRSVGSPGEATNPSIKEATSSTIPTPALGTGASIGGSHAPAVGLVGAAGDAAPGAAPTTPASRAEPASGPAVAAAAPPHTPDRSPAGQVAPVMVSLASSGMGTHRLVLRLDPPELGKLEISLVRAPDTSARVEITAERPTTLALLRLDEPALHRALSEAGVPVDGRSLTMQLGQPGAQYAGGQGGGGHGETGARRFGGWSGSGSEGFSDPLLPPAPRAIRSALDITA